MSEEIFDSPVDLFLYVTTQQEDRAAYPELFLLTQKESEVLATADLLIFRYLTGNTAEELRKNVAKLLKKHKITNELIRGIVDKIDAASFWSWSYDIDTVEKEKIDAYIINTQNTADKIPSRITGKTHPNFARKDIAGKARALHIPKGVLYLTKNELDSCSLLKSLFYDNEVRPSIIYRKTFKNREAIWNITAAALTVAKRAEDEDGYQLEDEIYSLTTANNVPVQIAGKPQNTLAGINVDKLLIFLEEIAQRSQYQDPRFTFTLTEYMNAMGLKDRKDAAKRLSATVEDLKRIELNIDIPNIKGYVPVLAALFTVRAKGQGGIYVTGEFNPYWLKFWQQQKNNLPVPRELLKIDSRHTNEYKFYMEFLTHARYNRGRGVEQNRLKISTLLKVSTLPSYESLPKKGAFAQRIADPFITALDNLKEYGLSYRLLWNGKPLNEAEMKAIRTDYAFFLEVVVEASWDNNLFPDAKHKGKTARK